MFLTRNFYTKYEHLEALIQKDFKQLFLLFNSKYFRNSVVLYFFCIQTNGGARKPRIALPPREGPIDIFGRTNNNETATATRNCATLTFFSRATLITGNTAVNFRNLRSFPWGIFNTYCVNLNNTLQTLIPKDFMHMTIHEVTNTLVMLTSLPH